MYKQVSRHPIQGSHMFCTHFSGRDVRQRKGSVFPFVFRRVLTRSQYKEECGPHLEYSRVVLTGFGFCELYFKGPSVIKYKITGFNLQKSSKIFSTRSSVRMPSPQRFSAASVLLYTVYFVIIAHEETLEQLSSVRVRCSLSRVLGYKHYRRKW